ncbi:MAG TPA: hypothetical protein VLF66_09515 [Thermoanaerobaculia bacterium]|nr:hypothetical protein [Thermoanaerobaculia bacterium]
MTALRCTVVALSVALFACWAGEGRGQAAAAEEARAPEFGPAFWEHWGDGRAELAGYDLMKPRYGEARRGTAVAIFVTEPFHEGARVKAEEAGPGTFQVLKLNLAQDFPTGIYDYNLMTSAFVALEPVAGLPAGAPAKVSFSAQEWCGHVYQQALFRGETADLALHSYFEGEGDEETRLPGGPGLSEDALLLWARGLAWPEVAPGETATVPVLTSLERSRLRHRPAAWEEAELWRSGESREVEAPAGTFEVEEARATLRGATGERTWTFQVEKAPPHRIVAWETSDGERAELLGTDRLPYWELNGPGGEEYLERLGLSPRLARTP